MQAFLLKLVARNKSHCDLVLLHIVIMQIHNASIMQVCISFQRDNHASTGVVICLERDADLHMAQLMPQPLTISCFSKI